MNNSTNEIINKLYDLYKKKGFLDEDTIFDAVIDAGLPLDEIERVCDILLSKGALVKSEETNTGTDDEVEDKAKVDYASIYSQITRSEPSLKAFIDSVKLIPPPKRKEVNNLMMQAKSGNQYAKNRIIEMYMRVAIRMAVEFSVRYEQSLEDTIQNALEGLVIAYDKYEIGEKDSFSIYISWWIRQRLRRSFIPKSKMYTPVHRKEIMMDILDIKKAHFCADCNLFDICPNLIDKIATKLEISQDQALSYYNLTKRLNTPLMNIDELEEKEILYSDTDIFEVSSHNILSESIKGILKTLTPREAKVVSLRFGLEDGRDRTLEEVGYEFNVTRERIRQIEAKAMRKLRHPSRSKKLIEFLIDV